MKRKFRNREEEVEAIRKEPAFKDLVEILKSQTADQLDRLGDYLTEGGEGDAEKGENESGSGNERAPAEASRADTSRSTGE